MYLICLTLKKCFPLNFNSFPQLSKTDRWGGGGFLQNNYTPGAVLSVTTKILLPWFSFKGFNPGALIFLACNVFKFGGPVWGIKGQTLRLDRFGGSISSFGGSIFKFGGPILSLKGYFFVHYKLFLLEKIDVFNCFSIIAKKENILKIK